MLSYGPLDPAQNPLFVLSCFSGMNIVVLDVHKEIPDAKPGDPLTIELSSAKAQSPLKGEVGQNETTGKTFGEASDINVNPVLELLRDPGPLTIKMGGASATMSEQGRAECGQQIRRELQARIALKRATPPLRAEILAKRREHCGDDAGGVEAGLLVHGLRLVVLDEAVRQHERAHLEALIEQPLAREIMQDLRAEASDRTFLEGDEHLVVACKLPHQVLVERLDRSAHRRRWSRGRSRQAGRSPATLRPSLAPKERMATVVPSRKMRPLPMGRTSPRFGSAAPVPSPRG